MSRKDSQLGLNFDSPASETNGYSRWQQERREALENMARKLGLPLGHRAEVILRDGACLKGMLQLDGEELWIEARRDFRLVLRIDRCTFEAREIESCIRLD